MSKMHIYLFNRMNTIFNNNIKVITSIAIIKCVGLLIARFSIINIVYRFPLRTVLDALFHWMGLPCMRVLIDLSIIARSIPDDCTSNFIPFQYLKKASLTINDITSYTDQQKHPMNRFHGHVGNTFARMSKIVAIPSN